MRYILLIFISISLFTSYGQTGVKGKLMDISAGEALPFASVVVYKTGDSILAGGVVSTFDGSFEITDLKPGTYYLKAHFYWGFDEQTIENIAVNQKSVDECG